MSAPTRRRPAAPQAQPGRRTAQQRPPSGHAQRSTRRPIIRGVGFRVPTLPRLIGVQIALVVACSAAVALHAPTRTVLAIALPLAGVPFVVVAGRSVFDWALTTVRYLTGKVPYPGVTIDETNADGVAFGVHWRGDRASCVLELRPPDGATTSLGRAEAATDPAVDLAAMARCLSQHDISVAVIDIVMHGARTASGSPVPDVYEHLIGPLPAVATRSVWVTVTVDVPTNTDAIEVRGGGRVGATRTVGIATERVARSLRSHGIQSRVLTRNEIQAAASHLCRGVAFDTLTENWRSAPLPGVIDTGFGFDCAKIDDAVLADLWATPSLSTTVVLRLTAGSTPEHVSISGSCRFVTRTTAPRPELPGIVSMNGRHRESLLTSLPLGITAPGYADPVRQIGYENLSRLRIPTAGCGQLLGSNSSGNGVATRLFGPGVRSVHVAGELYLAQQLVFRAIATGARVEVRTDRPHAWGPLVDSVATPDRLRIDGGPHRAGSRIDLVMQDFSNAIAGPPRAGTEMATVVTLTEHPPRSPALDPELSIIQPGAAGDRIHVRTRRRDFELMLVTIPQETAFIGRPRSVRRTGT